VNRKFPAPEKLNNVIHSSVVSINDKNVDLQIKKPLKSCFFTFETFKNMHNNIKLQYLFK